MMKPRSKRKQPRHSIGVEVSQNDLTMVVVSSSRDQQHVRGHKLTWRQDATSLRSEDGVRELTAAFATLATQEKLSGASIRVALSSDSCVTRVVAGDTDSVEAELRELRERSSHYLRLGAGKKAIAESRRAIDAKQVQKWLSVTHEDILNAIVHAAEQAGLEVSFMEHSMVALCRAVGRMGLDAECPVIVLEITDRGLELGVSYHGQLLFDYRPGGIDSKERSAEIVVRHLDRIQRYCNRHFRFASGTIQRVLLCGAPEELVEIQRQFIDCERLTAEVLDPAAVCAKWDYDTNVLQDSRYTAPLGSAVISCEQMGLPKAEMGLTNLMDFFHDGWKEPLWPALARVAWPVAATIVLALGVFAFALYERQKAAAVENETNTMEMVRGRVHEMKLKMEEATTRTNYLEQIDGSLLNPAWNDMVGMIGRCLPQNTWLNNVRVDHPGLVSITGTTADEDTVFDFLRYLKRVPVLTNVNLEAQRPTRIGEGMGVTFDIKCEYNEP